MIKMISTTAEDNPVLPFSTTFFPSLPGIYRIVHTSTQKTYYGESCNICQRLSTHRSKLKRKLHSVTLLQSDFNLYGIEAFSVQILEYGNSLEDVVLRKQREQNYLLTHQNRAQLYNTASEGPKGVLNPFFGRNHSETTKQNLSQKRQGILNTVLGRKIEIPAFRSRKNRYHVGGTFASIAEASRITGMARRDIRARVDSSEYPDWKEV